MTRRPRLTPRIEQGLQLIRGHMSDIASDMLTEKQGGQQKDGKLICSGLEWIYKSIEAEKDRRVKRLEEKERKRDPKTKHLR